MTTGPDAARLRRARWTTALVFLLFGVGMANWVVRIPAVRERLGLAEAALGLALLGQAAGALLAMPLAGRLVARHGSRPVARVGALSFGTTLALPALAPSFGLLVAALVALGAAGGTLNVAINAQAAAVERAYGRSLMSGLHALFSLGGLAGASMGGAAASAGLAAGPHLGLVALAAGVAAVASVGGMLAPRAEAAGAAAAGAGAPVPAADAAPGAAPDDGAAPGHATRALVALGAVAFCVLFGEGAMADWSAVYLRDVAGAGPGLAAVGYAAFSLTMAGGRLVGDRLTERLGPARLVRGGGLLAAAGLAAALVSGAPWAAVAGFGFVGAGLSTVFPVALAAAGRLTGRSAGGAIATVASCGYAGFLVGPPLIGFVAHAASLRAGLGLVVGTSAAIALLAGALRRHRAPRPAPALAGA